MLRAGAVIILVSSLAIFSLTIFSGERRSGNGDQGGFDYLITVGLVQGGETSRWKDALSESFIETFTAENGYKLVYSDGGAKQEKQIEEIQDMIARKVDYILLNPVVETGWEEVLEEAKEACIPVILIHNPIDDPETPLYECTVGSDYGGQMKRVGKWLEKYLEETGRKEEKITLVTLQGDIGSEEQMTRAEAFQGVLQKHENWKMKGQQTGNNNKKDGKEVMKLFLEQEPEVDVVIAENDEMALGAAEAVREAGKTCGPDGDVIIISFVGTNAGLRAVEEGVLNITFEESPALAPKVAETIQRLEAGIVVDHRVYVEERYFDSAKKAQKELESRKY